MLLYACWRNIQAYLPSPAFPLSLRAETNEQEASARSINQENRVDLNTADTEQLLSLPGIGPKSAEAILLLRDQLGGFRYPEDLLLISGIGAKKLDAIYDLVYISPAE